MTDASRRSTGWLRVGPEDDVDRYVLGAAIGSGAEGILYRATITTPSGLALDVAVKMLQPRFMSQVELWRSRWMEQLELLRSLQVPGLVPVRDGFIGALPHSPGEPGEGRTLYLVMNWVEGQPLDEWVRHRDDRDPIDDLKTLIPVAAALDLMHSGRATGGVPVAHRDVKPSNILVGEAGSVLVDFGLTKGLPEGHRLSGVVGTPGYLAPEAVESGTYSPATDRYALGAVAYFVLTGSEPPQSHEPGLLRSSLFAVPELSERPEIVDRVMAMMDADPEVRPTGLANWIGQLRHSSLPSLPEPLSPQAPSRHPPAPRKGPKRQIAPVRRFRLSRRALEVGTVVLAILGAATGIALFVTRQPPQHLVLSHQRLLTGVVRDAAGDPVPDAYVIGLESLTVVRTDSAGRFSMPCVLSTRGEAGRRAEPLVASTWLLPVETPGDGSYALGENTTNYGPPPSAPGPGYSFSGGATDASRASTARCDGHTFNFFLHPGGNVDIQIFGPTGKPVASSVLSPPDNLYLPGLGKYAASETAPLSSDGRQVLSELGSGVLRIDGTTATLDCSGRGVAPDPADAGADVSVVAGQTVSVICHET